jgi:hypothetical protein
MKIRKRVKALINIPETRQKLGIALGFTEQWIIRLINQNKENGPLTTAIALMIIRQETKLQDKEILEGLTTVAQN